MKEGSSQRASDLRDLMLSKIKERAVNFMILRENRDPRMRGGSRVESGSENVDSDESPPRTKVTGEVNPHQSGGKGIVAGSRNKPIFQAMASKCHIVPS